MHFQLKNDTGLLYKIDREFNVTEPSLVSKVCVSAMSKFKLFLLQQIVTCHWTMCTIRFCMSEGRQQDALPKKNI